MTTSAMVFPQVLAVAQTILEGRSHMHAAAAAPIILHLNDFFAIGRQVSRENDLRSWRGPVGCATCVRRLIDIFRCYVVDSIHCLLQSK